VGGVVVLDAQRTVADSSEPLSHTVWRDALVTAFALDRIKGTSCLREAERRKLAAVADHALALAGQGKVHLLQERHGDGDYSYWAVARAPSRSVAARMRLRATPARNRSAIADVANPSVQAPHHPELSMAAHLLDREEVAR
jgi:hypothetical protein